MAITQTYTIAEVFELESDDRHELIDGELFTLPGSGGRSSAIGARIGRFLGNYLDDRPFGFILGADGSFVLTRNPDTMLSPDAAYVSASRLPGGQLPETFVDTYPDFAIEVLSPSDRKLDAERKALRYLSAGTLLVWLVNPKTKTVTVYRQHRDPERFLVGQVLTGEDVLPGFEISVDVIFR